MEPKHSLPCSQQPAIGPYPEPDASSQKPSTLILIHSFHLRLGLPDGLLPSGLPTKILYEFLISSVRATFPAHLILLDLITQHQNKLMFNYELLNQTMIIIFTMMIHIG
jgi:hypothetical protein